MTDGIILYHGSYCEVKKPDLSKCRPGKDFGQGFYLTSSKEQASRFTKTAIRKAVADRLISDNAAIGYVNEFLYIPDSNLSVFSFSGADAEWLRCVVGHRKYNSMEDVQTWVGYDIMIGKIANDATNLVLTAYMDGIYGEVGSNNAIQTAIRLLEPEKLKDQFCFRTEKSLHTLHFVKSERIML